MSSQESSKSNLKKRERTQDFSLTDSVDVESSPKKSAQLDEENGALDDDLQTQVPSIPMPYPSEPLEDGILEAFDREEEAQSQSQQSGSVQSLSERPTQSQGILHSLSEQASLYHQDGHNSTEHGDTFGSESSMNADANSTPYIKVESDDPSIEIVQVVESKQNSEQYKPSKVKQENKPVKSESSSASAASAAPVVPLVHPHTPPSFNDVVLSESDWNKMVELLDTTNEGASKIVGVGVLFGGSSTNHHDNRDESNLTPETSATGYGLCLSTAKGLPYFVRLEESEYDVVALGDRYALLYRLFEDNEIAKYFWNAKNGYKPLLAKKRSFRPKNVIDPQIAAWVFSPESLVPFRFSQVCQHYLKDGPLPNYHAATNLAHDIMLAMSLTENLKAKLCAECLWEVLVVQEMPLVPLLALMEMDGILFDNEQLVASENHLNEMLKDLQVLANRVCGYTVQLSSPKQVADVLFNKIGLRPPKNKERKIASGRESTTEAILKSLSDQHPLPDIVLRYRKVQKFLSNWVASLNMRRMQGKLYSTWSQTSASTGRIISSKPNLQNLPRAALILDSVCTDRIGTMSIERIAPSLSKSRAPPSISVRSAFTAEKGCLFLSADFSQLEMRLLAHVSQDPSLIEFFNQGRDIHALVAAKWKGLPLDQITNDDRNAAKRLVYGIMYGMGPVSLADHLGVGVDVAKQFLSQFLTAYPSVQTFIERTKLLARKRGWVRTLFGRRRLLNYDESIQKDYSDLAIDDDKDTMDMDWDEPVDDLASDAARAHLGDVKRPDRQAVNSVIQGTAADIMKLAMVRIDEELREGWINEKGERQPGEPAARLLLQVHDELLYECPEASIKTVAKIVKRNMENMVAFSIPLTVQMRMGVRWGELKSLVIDSTPPRIALGFSDASYATDITDDINTTLANTVPPSTEQQTSTSHVSRGTEMAEDLLNQM